MPNAEPGSSPEAAVFFESRDAFIAWLDEHHADAPSCWVGLYKKGSGQVNMTWPESVDAALCFGWIDGQGKSLGEVARAIRFSPRRKGSIWSAVNVRRFGELAEQGMVRPAGHTAFAARREDRTAIYSHEQESIDFDAAQLAAFQENPAAWAFFSARPPSYRKAATWWVISAKREETRERRMQTLIEDSAQERLLGHLQRGKPATPAGSG
ncbi:MAG: YdeI/OmpD-associated family protein [Thermomicrobiales bacterium]